MIMPPNVATAGAFVTGHRCCYIAYRYSEYHASGRLRRRDAHGRPGRPRQDAVGLHRLPLSLLALVRLADAERPGLAPDHGQRDGTVEERRADGRAPSGAPQAAAKRAGVDHRGAGVFRAAALAALG